MSEKSVEERVQDLLVEHLCLEGRPEPGENLHEDLGADSLDVIEVVLMLEDEFGVKISDDEADRMVTVQDIIEFLEKEKVGG